MKSHIEHKGYVGTIEFDTDDDSLFGRVVNIAGTIMYAGDTIAELRENMAAQVDAYLELCAEDGVDPSRPFSGKVVLRMDPELHALASAEAHSKGLSLNTFLVLATTDAVFSSREERAPKAAPAPNASPPKRPGVKRTTKVVTKVKPVAKKQVATKQSAAAKRQIAAATKSLGESLAKSQVRLASSTKTASKPATKGRVKKT